MGLPVVDPPRNWPCDGHRSREYRDRCCAMEPAITTDYDVQNHSRMKDRSLVGGEAVVVAVVVVVVVVVVAVVGIESPVTRCGAHSDCCPRQRRSGAPSADSPADWAKAGRRNRRG